MATLYYFPLYARGEIIRYILHHTETPFTDRFVEFSEWPELKASGLSPTTQMPMLEIDGHKLTGQVAISTYLAKKNGLLPEDPYELWKTFSVIDQQQDYHDNYTKNGKVRGDPEGSEKWWNEKGALKLQLIENILKENNEGQGFFFGDKITLADLVVYQMLNDWFLNPEAYTGGWCFNPDNVGKRAQFLEPFPLLVAFCERMADASPGLKSYLETRPVRPA